MNGPQGFKIANCRTGGSARGTGASKPRRGRHDNHQGISEWCPRSPSNRDRKNRSLVTDAPIEKERTKISHRRASPPRDKDGPAHDKMACQSELKSSDAQGVTTEKVQQPIDGYTSLPPERVSDDDSLPLDRGEEWRDSDDDDDNVDETQEICQAMPLSSFLPYVVLFTGITAAIYSVTSRTVSGGPNADQRLAFRRRIKKLTKKKKIHQRYVVEETSYRGEFECWKIADIHSGKKCLLTYYADQETFEERLQVYSSITGRHISNFECQASERDRIPRYIAVEMPRETLDTWMKRPNLCIGDKLQTIYQLSKTIEKLHDHGFVLFDFGPANFGLDYPYEWRIIHLEKIVRQGTRTSVKEFREKFGFVTPEMRNCETFGLEMISVQPAHNIFCFAVLVYKIITGKSLVKKNGNLRELDFRAINPQVKEKLTSFFHRALNLDHTEGITSLAACIFSDGQSM